MNVFKSVEARFWSNWQRNAAEDNTTHILPLLLSKVFYLQKCMLFPSVGLSTIRETIYYERTQTTSFEKSVYNDDNNDAFHIPPPPKC